VAVAVVAAAAAAVEILVFIDYTIKKAYRYYTNIVLYLTTFAGGQSAVLAAIILNPLRILRRCTQIVMVIVVRTVRDCVHACYRRRCWKTKIL